MVSLRAPSTSTTRALSESTLPGLPVSGDPSVSQGPLLHFSQSVALRGCAAKQECRSDRRRSNNRLRARNAFRRVDNIGRHWHMSRVKQIHARLRWRDAARLVAGRWVPELLHDPFDRKAPWLLARRELLEARQVLRDD